MKDKNEIEIKCWNCAEESVFNTLDEAKQWAQEWLDNLVEECVEFCDSSVDSKNICVKKNAEKLETKSEGKK